MNLIRNKFRINSLVYECLGCELGSKCPYDKVKLKVPYRFIFGLKFNLRSISNNHNSQLIMH